MEHALQTIPGKTNIAHDILVFPVNTKQYSEILAQVLKWCESKDITPNLQKSVFCKNNLKCYDFMFSEGMKPGPEKKQEIRETPAAENEKAL